MVTQPIEQLPKGMDAVRWVKDGLVKYIGRSVRVEWNAEEIGIQENTDINKYTNRIDIFSAGLFTEKNELLCLLDRKERVKTPPIITCITNHKETVEFAKRLAAALLTRECCSFPSPYLGVKIIFNGQEIKVGIV